jgi:hypothetical protein
MSYTEFLSDLNKKTEGAVLYMAGMTKNIYEIDHLVEKRFLPAVLKRLEMAATNNEVEKVGELRRIGLEITPLEYVPELKAKMDEIVDLNSPKLVRRSKLTV